MRRRWTLGLVGVLTLGTTFARGAEPIYPPPKVPLAFNRLYDYPQLVDAMRALVKGHPNLLSMRSLGKSTEGRDLWCLTLNNPDTGPDRSKPAMYVDGNIHGNEIQGAEATLYLVWYLLENRERVPALKALTDERAFYVVPTINPDGRAFWFNAPNTTNSSRSGKSPRDDDRDGLFDEDGYDDVDGDGQVTDMRRKNPVGSWRVSPDDPRILVPVQPGDKVRPEDRYDNLGTEGIDNDGDGLVNEDAPGGYDMNRNWPADWQPDYQQFGAGDYPLCWPETRSVALFLLDHPNVAGVQAFHNAAGMILRGPGHPSRQAEYPPGDDRVAALIGRNGERMIPFYRSLVIHKDLYSVHGGFIGWTYEHLGIFSFTNELWNGRQLLGTPEPNPGAARVFGGGEADDLFASDRLLFGAAFRPWKAFKHPLYGDVEIGGFVKESQRIPPTFLIEELCHRNAAFVIYHAEQMPRLAWAEVTAKPVEGAAGTYAVTASVRNTRLIPSVSEQAARRKAGLPDTASLSGTGLTVVAGGPLVNVDTGEVRPAERTPEVIRLESGVPGEQTVRVRWFVLGKPGAEVAVRYASQKGGTLERKLTLP
ncbi:MAG: M14 family metallopeptidase [Isosphaeraceae bacterium]